MKLFYLKRIELGKDITIGVVETVALGDVFISPHSFCVGPVETSGDLFQCGWAAVIPRVLDRCAMIDVPYSRGIHPDCAMVIPTHPMLEGPFDMMFKFSNRTTKVLNAA